MFSDSRRHKQARYLGVRPLSPSESRRGHASPADAFYSVVWFRVSRMSSDFNGRDETRCYYSSIRLFFWSRQNFFFFFYLLNDAAAVPNSSAEL